MQISREVRAVLIKKDPNDMLLSDFILTTSENKQKESKKVDPNLQKSYWLSFLKVKP